VFLLLSRLRPWSARGLLGTLSRPLVGLQPGPLQGLTLALQLRIHMGDLSISPALGPAGCAGLGPFFGLPLAPGRARLDTGADECWACVCRLAFA